MATVGTIEVDPAVYTNESDNDYLSSGYDTSTQSLASSINEYILENGRRYHTYYGIEKNMLPTDEVEQNRLDLHHEILLRLLGGKLFEAPIVEPARVLDVGTGTGIWAIDMADQFPMAEVIGMDINPIQPQWVPPNCRFEVDDAELEWTYKADFFDFIHARNISASISDWPKLMSEIHRCTAPGGYVELAELGSILKSDDNTMKPTNQFKVYVDLVDKAMNSIGRSFPVIGTLSKRLKDAGFVDVREIHCKQPFGPWPKDIKLKHVGAMALIMAETGIEGYGLAAFTRILGMDHEEANEILAAAKVAVKNKNTHMYNGFHVAYGRKPE